MPVRKSKSPKKKVFKKKLQKKANLRRAKKKIKPPTISGQALSQIKIKAKTKKKIKTLKKHKIVLKRAPAPPRRKFAKVKSGQSRRLVKNSLTRKKTAKKKIIPGSRKIVTQAGLRLAKVATATQAGRGKNKIAKRKTLRVSKKKVAKKKKTVKKILTTVKRKLLLASIRRSGRGTIKRVNKTKKTKKTKKLQKTFRKSLSRASASTKKLRPRKRGVPKYFLNYQFQFIDELRDLILKSSPDEMNNMTRQLSKLGKIKLAVATGIFLNKVNPDSMTTDLFIVVDDIDRRKFRSLLHSIEADLGREIRYVIMEKEEFQYRLSMFDRFIRVLLESPHEKLINHLGV